MPEATGESVEPVAHMRLAVDIQRKQYSGGACAIRGLQFEAATGEFVAIVGPSGAGKSTLLKIIGGLDTDYEGTVQLPKAAHLGYMFQEPRLMPWLTVLKNLQLVQPSMPASQLHCMLEDVGLKGCADLYPNQLSGGMQRRVALLRAFIVEPQILLMDEPFQSLDVPTAEQLRRQLLALWERGHPTVLFVTHSLPEALALANRVLFFSEGPSCIVLDCKVELPTPRTMDSQAVLSMAQQLLQCHPELLQGRTQTVGAARR